MGGLPTERWQGIEVYRRFLLQGSGEFARPATESGADGEDKAGARFATRGDVSVEDEAAAMRDAEKAFESLSPAAQDRMRRVAAEQAAEVREFYKDSAGWLKAPNGEPTKLTEAQWVQVRTPLFKRWFGDWEAAAEIANLPRSATKKDADTALAALAGKNLINLATRLSAQINTRQRTKITSNKALAASLVNGFTAGEHNAAASAVATLWKHAEILGSGPDADGDENIASIKRFASPLFIGNGETAVAYLTVKESVDHGHRIYSVELTEMRKLRRKGGTPEGDTTSAAFEKTIRRLASKVNPDSVSKVVDENGEPRVVWHNSEARFSEFDLGRARTSSDIQAFFFKDREDPYNEYGRNRYPSFLNLKNPTNYRQAVAGFDPASTDDAGIR